MLGAKLHKIFNSKPLVVFAVVLVALMAVSLLTARPAHAKTFTVNSTANPGSGICNATECTLQEAVNEASHNGETDAINFASGLTGEIPLHNTPSQGGFSIFNDTPAQDLRINGPGASVLAVNGNNETRAFGIASGANVTISGLTIKNGKTYTGDPNAGGLGNGGTLTLNNSTVSSNNASSDGGGIYNHGGTLTLNNSTVSANKSLDSTNSPANGGGGVFNFGGILTLNKSTVSANQANNGGGIYSNTSLGTTVINSTVSGNTSSHSGGGIFNFAGFTAVENSTVTSNNIGSFSNGSGIVGIGDSFTRTEVLSSIVAGNPGPDVGFIFRGTNSFVSGGFNLIGDGNATPAFNQTGDRTDVSNPGLGLLANNGGPTQTHALFPGSPAIDAGTNTSCPSTDQRGAPRPWDGDGNGTATCDIGAFEKGAPPPDTTPPPAPIISSPPNNSYDTDGSIILSGSAEKGSTVRIYEGALLKGAATANATTGAWSKGLTGLANGKHTFTAKATDKAGNTSPASAPRTIIVDKVKPTVLSTVVPASGALNVPPTTNVIATFSEPMKPTTLTTSTVRLVRSGTSTPVPAVVSYSPTTKKVTLNPKANLLAGARYTVTITTGARDLAGNSLAAAKVWSFTVKR